METPIKIAWKEMLDRAPAIIALAGAVALVLSYLYQIAYFAMRGSTFAVGELSIADLADHAGLAVSLCALVASSLVVSSIKSLGEGVKFSREVQDWDLERLKAETVVLQKDLKKIRNRASLLFVSISLLGLLDGLFFGWSAVTVVFLFFPFLFVFSFFDTLWLGKLSSQSVDRRDLSIISDILFATAITVSTAGFLGASARDCPKRAEIDYGGGKHIDGDLIGSLNRGVVLGEKGGSISSMIPWSQITKFSEQSCPDIPIHPGFYLPWGGGKNLWPPLAAPSVKGQS